MNPFSQGTRKKAGFLNLVEALHNDQERLSAVLGLLAIGFMFLSIYLFGKEAGFSIFAFPAFFVTTALFLYSGYQPAGKNAWFARLFAFLNGLMELLALAGWIWILYLSQENPGGRYENLSNLDFTTFLFFFFLIDTPGFLGLMLSMFRMHKNQKQPK